LYLYRLVFGLYKSSTIGNLFCTSFLESWGNCQLYPSVTLGQFCATCATSFRAPPAITDQVQAMDAKCGLSTCGHWDGTVMCNEIEKGVGSSAMPLKTGSIVTLISTMFRALSYPHCGSYAIFNWLFQQCCSIIICGPSMRLCRHTIVILPSHNLKHRLRHFAKSGNHNCDTIVILQITLLSVCMFIVSKYFAFCGDPGQLDPNIEKKTEFHCFRTPSDASEPPKRCSSASESAVPSHCPQWPHTMTLQLE
jgi:hypothetical protein